MILFCKNIFITIQIGNSFAIGIEMARCKCIILSWIIAMHWRTSCASLFYEIYRRWNYNKGCKSICNYGCRRKVNGFRLITLIRKIPLQSSSSLPSSQSFSLSHLKSFGTHSPLAQENLSSSQAKYSKYREKCISLYQIAFAQ